jgi:insertion element IS1 protein InsB
MTCITVRCPYCDSKQIVKRGTTHHGTQRYLCQNTACARGSFLLIYCNRGCLPEVKHHIIAMSLPASGARDTARVLPISTDTVLNELKKKEVALASVTTALLRTMNPDDMAVHIERAGAAEMDDMWSVVGKNKAQRWLWHAIEHGTGAVVASVFGRRKDAVFLQLQALLELFGITRSHPDPWGAYARHLDPAEHHPGKRNTQNIARKPLTLRARMQRLGRKTLCFPTSTQMQDIVIGLCVNRSAFGRAVSTWPSPRLEHYRRWNP